MVVHRSTTKKGHTTRRRHRFIWVLICCVLRGWCCFQIMDLEAQNAALTEDLANAGKGKKIDSSQSLPREPAKLTLTGHRTPITAVLFHPIFSIVVSASEDCTIKVSQSQCIAVHRSTHLHPPRLTVVLTAIAGACVY